jgi:hypothetical protein
MLVVFVKVVELPANEHGGAEWYSSGQGIVADIKSDDGDTLTLVPHSGDEQEIVVPKENVVVVDEAAITLGSHSGGGQGIVVPKESVVVVDEAKVEVLDSLGVTHCMTCGKELGKAVWVTGDERNCNACHATHHTTESGARFEYDPTADRWIKTADLPGTYFQVEYDEQYSGGDYDKVGQFALIHEAVIDALNEDDHDAAILLAFEKVTGIKAIHVVHYNLDDPKDHKGEDLEV